MCKFLKKEIKKAEIWVLDNSENECIFWSLSEIPTPIDLYKNKSFLHWMNKKHLIFSFFMKAIQKELVASIINVTIQQYFKRIHNVTTYSKYHFLIIQNFILKSITMKC